MAPSVMAGQLGAPVGFYKSAEVRAHHSSSDHSANPLVWDPPLESWKARRTASPVSYPAV